MSKPCTHTLSFGAGTKASPDRCVNCAALFERDVAKPFGYASLGQSGARPKLHERYIYTSGNGHEFTAVVMRVHKAGGAKIRAYFPIRDGEELTSCFQGDMLEVTDFQLAFKTQAGVSVDRLGRPTPTAKPMLPATVPPRSAGFQAFLEKNDLEKHCVETPGANPPARPEEAPMTEKTHKLIASYKTRNGRRNEETFPVTEAETTEPAARAAAITRAQTYCDGRGWTFLNHRFEAA